MGFFHSPVRCLPSGVEGWEKRRAFWSGSGLGWELGLEGHLVPGLAFWLSQDRLNFFRSRSLPLVLGPLAGMGRQVQTVCHAGVCAVGMLGCLQGWGVELAGCPVFGALWWASSDASSSGSGSVLLPSLLCPRGGAYSMWWVGAHLWECAPVVRGFMAFGFGGRVLWCMPDHSRRLVARSWAPWLCRAFAWGVMCPGSMAGSALTDSCRRCLWARRYSSLGLLHWLLGGSIGSPLLFSKGECGSPGSGPPGVPVLWGANGCVGLRSSVSVSGPGAAIPHTEQVSGDRGEEQLLLNRKNLQQNQAICYDLLEVEKQTLKKHWEEKREPVRDPQTGVVVGGIFGMLIFIAVIIGIVFLIRKYQQGTEGPPKHKPPPPVKAGSSTEMLNKPSEPPTATEIVPLSPGDVYYEPTGGEPVTVTNTHYICTNTNVHTDLKQGFLRLGDIL
ncbi:hypothetical protein CHARACLAT_006252 [Characodon lateralis]|uniref:Uncharacterized protein n=1 Tax=Characodon lateralis TaxID=208331 RepID=A0ABU7DNS8_9TELE|nr:hypothetical protein [Characodon lateralis]